MALTSYAFDARSSGQFLRLRDRLYRNDSNWIAPLETESLAQFAPDFGFYQKSRNRHRHFMVTAGRRVVGHASALVNADLRDRDGTQVGAVGFFECEDCEAAAADLLGAATEWLRKENGPARIWGPLNFDIWHGYRFMTRGFGQRPFLGEPYNKDYYQEHFEHFGFRVRQTWNSVDLIGRPVIESVISRQAKHYRSLVADGYHFVPMDLRQPAEMRQLYDVLTQSFQHFLGFTPLTLGDFERIHKAGRAMLDRRLMGWAVDNRGAVAGFWLAYPDHAGAVRAMRGKNTLVARLRFLFHRRSTRRAVYYLIGVVPKMTKRGVGLGRALSYYAGRSILESGYDQVVVALMAEGNSVRGLLGRQGPRPQREYALYELNG